MAKILNKEAPPFPLTKPNQDTYLASAEDLGYGDGSVKDALDNTVGKTDGISKQSTQSEEQALVFETDGGVQIGKIDANGADFTNLKRGGQQVARMSDLPTKDSSIGENPSTTHVPTTKAVKDYVDANATGDLPIEKEGILTDESDIVIADDNNNPVVTVNNNGLDAIGIKKNGKNVLDEDETAALVEETMGGITVVEQQGMQNRIEVKKDDNDMIAYFDVDGFHASAFYDLQGNPIRTEPLDTDYIIIPSGTDGTKGVIVGWQSDANKDNQMNNVFGNQNMGAHIRETAWINAQGEKSFTAHRNCAFGYHSLFQCYSGAYNTAYGNESLDNVTTGSYNTALGMNALQSYGHSNDEVNCNQNTAVGADSLQAVGSVRGNTAVGYKALGGVTDPYSHTSTLSCGDYNIAIGYQAGRYAQSNYEVYIGTCAQSYMWQNNTEEKESTLIYGKCDAQHRVAQQFLQVNGMFAANGVTPQAALVAESDATDLASALTLLNQIKDALIKSGIMKPAITN